MVRTTRHTRRSNPNGATAGVVCRSIIGAVPSEQSAWSSLSGVIAGVVTLDYTRIMPVQRVQFINLPPPPAVSERRGPGGCSGLHPLRAGVYLWRCKDNFGVVCGPSWLKHRRVPSDGERFIVFAHQWRFRKMSPFGCPTHPTGARLSFLALSKFRIVVETRRNRPSIVRNRRVPVCGHRAGYFRFGLAQFFKPKSR